MAKRVRRGGEVNVLRVLRHDLLGEEPAPLPFLLRVAMVLTALAAVMTAVRIF